VVCATTDAEMAVARSTRYQTGDFDIYELADSYNEFYEYVSEEYYTQLYEQAGIDEEALMANTTQVDTLSRNYALFLEDADALAAAQEACVTEPDVCFTSEPSANATEFL